MDNTDNTTRTNPAIKVKFIDGSRHANDKSPWALSSSVAFVTESGDGISILFNERLSYVPGDKLYIKFDDTYGGSNETDEIATGNTV